MGEALASCILLAGQVKFEGEINLQFQGDEQFPLLLVQCTHDLHVRAFAKFKDQLTEEEHTQAFLNGNLSLVINPDNKTQQYQSVVPIHSIQMSENIMHYFAQSEQIASMVWLASNDHQVAGMLLQLMPDQDTLEREQFWEYAVQLGQTIRNDELLSLDNETLLHRLYHETELRLYPKKNIAFRCRCNRKKMQDLIKMLGKEDTDALLKEQGSVTVACEFCNQSYHFDPIDVALFFRS
ncbi:MAG: Hsp33 family molecular chaperone HslO, partial [Legionellaceae bacterium]